ncbi:type IV secretion system protein VirB10 [Acidocella sp.]|jgi:type IV secretion system protein VirB10|uniref:type IV secretion system protein VirB10 n=1 Tax=Acidocella sp. TaxID=50710 RepID=UPI002601EDB5|nr:type IV secretion system protein VirB10 [Acidocella sp.]MDD2794625.1 type IV secretion system protein VirB10 [Acidocella sp.]
MSENNQSPVEQGKSPVAGEGGRQMSMGTKLGILGLVGALALGFVWFNALYSHRQKAQPAASQTAYTGGGQQFTQPPPTTAKPPPPPALPQPAPAAPTSFLGTGSNQQTPATAPIMAYSGQGSLLPSLSAAAAPASGGGSPPAPPPAPDSSPLGARLKATPLDGEQAAILANPNMTITEGTMIPCSLQTAIDSQLPGLVTCVVPIDIRGTTGNVVLLDRGTKIVGQIQSGLLQGQNRVFVDWTRAETPDHVIITLDSPGTDELGRSGLPGAVNNHFWDRFGGALMLTLVQGGLDAGTVLAAGNGSSNSTSQQAALGFVYSAQSNGQAVANTALQNTINIPPTLTKNQGDTVGLIVAHDLDFSNVYKLQVNNSSFNNGQPVSLDNGG